MILKRVFIFLLLITGLGTHVTHSQMNIDSLERALRNSVIDSVQFEILISLSGEYQYRDFSKADKYSTQAAELVEKNRWDWAKPKLLSQQAFLASLSGDYTSAIRYDNENLNLVIEAGDSSAIAEGLNFLGNDYMEIGKFDEAYYYFTQSHRVARAIDDSLKMTKAIFNIGRVLNELGQYDLALDHFEVSSTISRSIGDLDGIPYCDEVTGDVYLRKKEYDKAEEYLLKARAGIRTRKVIVIEPRALKHLAQLQYEKGDTEKALAYYDTAAFLFRQASNEFGVAEINLGISAILIKEERFAEAQGLIVRSLETAKQFNAERMEINCYQQLSELAEKQGDYKAALAYHKNFKLLEDSLFSQDMLEKVFQDQLRFQTETKDFEIAALSKAKSERETELRREEFLRNILVVVIALVAILLFTVYRSGQRRIRINKLLVEHQDEIKRRSQELEQLNKVKDKFFSIISHDLRSPMNALSAILDMMDNDQITREEFTNLSKELRVQFNHTRTLISNLLDWALLQMDKLKIQPERINLATLVDENFKLLSSIQTKEIKLVNRVSQNLWGLGDLNMINLVFRNLILNAIKFSEKGSTVEVRAQERGEFIEVSIQDNGVGIRPDIQKLLFDKTSGYSTRGTANEKGTGLGLILCKEFVEKNGGQIWLESEEGKGSTFYFTVKKAS